MTGTRLCRCGCGHPAAGRSAYSSDACKARWNRSGRPGTALTATSGKPPTQQERVLAALTAAGPAGICQADFLLPSVIDGHRPIQRVAPRIEELRGMGHRIDTLRDPNGCGRYVLTQLAVPHIPGGKEAPDGASPPQAPPPCAEQAVAGEPALFDPGAYGRPGLMDAA